MEKSKKAFWKTGDNPITGQYISNGPPGSNNQARFKKKKKKPIKSNWYDN